MNEQAKLLDKRLAGIVEDVTQIRSDLAARLVFEHSDLTLSVRASRAYSDIRDALDELFSLLYEDHPELLDCLDKPVIMIPQSFVEVLNEQEAVAC